ncbi:MAG TPA: hypothetical protein V6D19_16195 [Stenomitos sp.]
MSVLLLHGKILQLQLILDAGTLPEVLDSNEAPWMIDEARFLMSPLPIPQGRKLGTLKKEI